MKREVNIMGTSLIAVGRQRGMRHPEAWAAKVMTARMAKRAGAG